MRSARHEAARRCILVRLQPLLTLEDVQQACMILYLRNGPLQFGVRCGCGWRLWSERRRFSVSGDWCAIPPLQFEVGVDARMPELLALD